MSEPLATVYGYQYRDGEYEAATMELPIGWLYITKDSRGAFVLAEAHAAQVKQAQRDGQP